MIKDKKNRVWNVNFTVRTFKETRARFGDLLDPQYFLVKTQDAVFLCDLLWTLVEKEAERCGVDENDFLDSFSGDEVEGARKELLERYVDFFPRQARDVMRHALQKIEALQEEARNAAVKQIEDQVGTTGVEG